MSKEETAFYGWASLTTLLTKMAGQSTLLSIFNSKIGKWKQLWEQVLHRILIKPGIDAFRVASEQGEELRK